MTRLSGTLAPPTVASCHSLLSGIMKSAVRSRVIAFNPCEGVRLPARRKTATAEVTISRQELTELLLPALPLRYRALATTAALAGMRWGECVGMRCDAVDLGGRELHVVRVAVEVGGHVMAKPYQKSKAGRCSGTRGAARCAGRTSASGCGCQPGGSAPGARRHRRRSAACGRQTRR